MNDGCDLHVPFQSIIPWGPSESAAAIALRLAKAFWRASVMRTGVMSEDLCDVTGCMMGMVQNSVSLSDPGNLQSMTRILFSHPFKECTDRKMMSV